MHQQQTAFENIVGKGENARKEQFLLFPQCFLLNQIFVSTFVHVFDIISLFAAEFEKPKIGLTGKGLNFIFFFSAMFCTLLYAGPINVCLTSTSCMSQPHNKIVDLSKFKQ